MTRAALKTGVVTAFHLAGGSRLARRRQARAEAPPVAYFHRVVPDPAALPGANRSLSISTASFEWLLDELGRAYRFVPLGERLARGSRPPLTLTFDDGYRDFYEHAFPILARKGIPATVFVITDLTGSEEPPLHDVLLRRMKVHWPRAARPVLADLLRACGIAPADGLRSEPSEPFAAFRALWTTIPRARLRALADRLALMVEPDPAFAAAHRVMDWTMLRRVHAAGIGVGSHTRSHALLPNETLLRVRDELRRSRAELEERLEAPVDALSYPDGAFDDRVVAEAAAAGYRLGLTTCGCRDRAHPELTLPRRHFWEAEIHDVFGRRSAPMVQARMAGLFDRTSGCAARHAPCSTAEARSAFELAESL